MSERLQRVVFFFPFQLFWVQLKKNYIILLFWAILFAYITRNLALKYGIPNLFLYPEYMGEVNFLSHFIIGFACGVFIMAFNISSYIINSYRFPFIATLSRPFLKFCYNNLIIPLSFVLMYIYQLIYFQLNVELETPGNVLMNISGFITGNISFILFSVSYFLTTNKSVLNILGSGDKKKEKKGKDKKGKEKQFVRDVFHRPSRWEKILNRQSPWKIETYLASPFKIALARSSTHYNEETLRQVFNQNHINASLFEILMVGVILTIGVFNENPIFNLPASASIILLFAIILMLASAIHSWIKGWTIPITIMIMIGLNYASEQDIVNYTNYAYGMNYQGEKANFDNKFLREEARQQFTHDEDRLKTIEILEKWKTKAMKGGKKLPKLVIITVSGGGLRSSMWSNLALTQTNEALDGKLMQHTPMITGSSGGMIGAAYFRETYLRDAQGWEWPDGMRPSFEDMGKDMLNPIGLNLVVSDWFIRYKELQDGDYSYTKDRGYAFEKVINENTHGLLDKRLRDYKEAEANAKIPMMIFTPTIINDGRKLLISSQDVSYLTDNRPADNMTSSPLFECIEFRRYFKNQDAENVRFTSVLRMNATFPYILPVVSLPSEPVMQVMDAGIRDNYGLVMAVKYLYTFKEWINKNTSGVVILQVRDKQKSHEPKGLTSDGVWKNLMSPLGNFYSNWTTIQSFEQDQMLQYTSAWFDGKIEVLSLELRNQGANRVSLSWHLTNKEKNVIRGSLYHQDNLEVIDRLKYLLDEH